MSTERTATLPGLGDEVVELEEPAEKVKVKVGKDSKKSSSSDEGEDGDGGSSLDEDEPIGARTMPTSHPKARNRKKTKKSAKTGGGEDEERCAT